MTSNDPLVSIVVLSYERLDDIKRCVDSIRKYTNLPYELVIFDNGSGTKKADGSAATPSEIENSPIRQYLQSIDDTVKDGNGRIKVIYNQQNEGCSVGRRKATEQVSQNSKYVVYLDNDMEVHEGWDSKMVGRLEKDSSLAAANAKLVFPDGKVQFTGCAFSIEDNYFFKPIYIDAGKTREDPTLDGEVYTPLVCGGATIFRKEALQKVKHSPAYLNGFEDWDVAFQLLALGYKLGNVDTWFTHHHISHSDSRDAESVYKKDRGNGNNIFESSLAFLERTGLNTIRDSPWFRWVDKGGNKPYLTRGHYTDLFHSRRLSELESTDIRRQFDDILAQRAQSDKTAQGTIDMKVALANAQYTGKQDLSPRMSFAEIEEILSTEYQSNLKKAYSTLNIRNLATELSETLEKDRSKTDSNAVYHDLEQTVLGHGKIKDRQTAEKVASLISKRVYQPGGQMLSHGSRDGIPNGYSDLVETYHPRLNEAFDIYNMANLGRAFRYLVDRYGNDIHDLARRLVDCIMNHGKVKDRNKAISLANDMAAKVVASKLLSEMGQ